ncbi:MAG: T9SS type A sorting domain-containing protein, partial [Bacteroidetes bacterium]|nr:T9SS type A sorting domain-containing protein [Bacteroidota bacterium]
LPFNLTYSQKGGYADKLSVAQGETLTLYISSDVTKFPISIFKMGASVQFIMESDSVIGIVQSVRDSSFWFGVNWSPTYSFVIPQAWTPGVYRAEYPITSDTTAAIIFIVKEDSLGSYSKNLFVLSTNTWNAYNSYGGKSLYSFNSSNSERSFKVSFQRPFERDLGIFGSPDYYRYENKLINWAGNNNVLFEMASMYDLDVNPSLLSNYNIVFIAGHNEYWSRAERRQFENFVDDGGKIINMSGNTSWWQVRFEDNGKTMVCYKDKSLDPLTGVQDSLVTVNWWDVPVNDPANVLFGADFREGGFVNTGSFLLKQDGYGDYAAFNTHYWIFNGTGLKEGDEFGFDREIVGYEADGALYYYNNGVPTVIDTLNEPLNYRIFGVSPTERADPILQNFGHATMGMFTNQNGGAVFNAATTNWVNGLLTDISQNITPDAVVDKITQNVYNKFKENRLPPEIVSWSPFMTDNVTINFDPVVLNSRDVLVSLGDSQLLTVNSVDPKNQTLHYSWEIDGTPVGTDDSSYTFTNNEATVLFTKFTAKVYVYNLEDTSSISWNMFDSPLVISSTYVSQVNPGDNYSYQVETFNFNRDTLTYLLVSPTPNWLSIDTTGLMTGTAPSLPQVVTVAVRVDDKSGNIDIQIYNINVITGINDESAIPNTFKLFQNYPNPFNPSTTISFQLPALSFVSLKIYDVLGREVKTLINKEMKAGSYKVDFNASQLSSGIYFYRLTASSFVQTKKMILMK